MSDRIDEYHGAEAKVLTTDEVESWVYYASTEHESESESMLLVARARILATTRALEKLEEGLKLWHGLPPDERAMVAIENDGKMWRQAVAERDKAELMTRAQIDQIRDEAKTLVSELVTALESCTEWMRCNPPVNGWGLLNHAAEADCSEALARADAALAKTKGATNG